MRGRGMYSYTNRSRGTDLASPLVSLRSASLHSLCSARFLASVETNGMEWNGMEWNGMEWNGMEWNGME